MPRSKRDKHLSLTRVDKKSTKARKAELIEQIHNELELCAYVWVFTMEHMRNNAIKQVREAWKGSRLFLGRNAVMRKALGTCAEDEHRPGSHQIGDLLVGDAGLLFTNEEPQVVTEWFASYSKPDFARTGNEALRTVILPAGPVHLAGDERAQSSMQPELRRLGLPSDLVRGVPTLSSEYTVCRGGKALKSDQVNLLKHLGIQMATFQIIPEAYVHLATGVLAKVGHP